MPYILVLLMMPFLSFWNNVKICDFFMNHDKKVTRKQLDELQKLIFGKISRSEWVKLYPGFIVTVLQSLQVLNCLIGSSRY